MFKINQNLGFLLLTVLLCRFFVLQIDLDFWWKPTTLPTRRGTEIGPSVLTEISQMFSQDLCRGHPK